MVFPMRKEEAGPLSWSFIDDYGIPRHDQMPSENTQDDRLRDVILDDNHELPKNSPRKDTETTAIPPTPQSVIKDNDVPAIEDFSNTTNSAVCYQRQ